MSEEKTKEAALYEFFNSLRRIDITGEKRTLPGYLDTAVPDDVRYPYLTYTCATSAWGEGNASLTVNIFDRTTSEADINEWTRILGHAVPPGGTRFAADGGYIWLRRGTPWCQAYVDQNDKLIKRRYINVIAEYHTME